MTTPIIHLIIVIVLVGLVLYLINRYVPMQSIVKTILNVVVVLILLLWILKVFGVY